jgi:cell division protein FtsW
MMRLDRTDRSLVGTWWWTVDRFMLAGFLVLALVGVLVVLAASPPVAATLRLPAEHFVVKHVIFLIPAGFVLVGVSLLSARGCLRLAVGMLAVFGLLLALTPVLAPEIKGARRWIALGGQLLQPSEFVKPALAVVSAWLLARLGRVTGFPASALVVGLVLTLLLQQPDLGMVALVTLVYGCQLFVAGLPWLLVGVLGAACAVGVWLAYGVFDHVRERIDSFLDPSSVGYQVEKAMRAVASGGLFGRGPGEGVEKFSLPDAHTDFVFAATAEEFGIVACVLLVLLFAMLLLRGLDRASQAGDAFAQLAATGLIAQLGLQAMINMAVNLNLMPTKGMTLPFVSYGGSSMLALALGMGMLLALTRRGACLGERP